MLSVQTIPARVTRKRHLYMEPRRRQSHSTSWWGNLRRGSTDDSEKPPTQSRSPSLPEDYPVCKSGHLRLEYVAYLRKRMAEENRTWSATVLRSTFGYDLERQINDGAARQKWKRQLPAAFELHRKMSNLPDKEMDQLWRDVLPQLNAKLKLKVTGIMHMGADDKVTCEEFLRHWEVWVDECRWDRTPSVLFHCTGSIRWK